MGTPAIRRGMCGGCIDFCIRQLFLELGDDLRRNGVNPRVLAAVIQPQSLQPRHILQRRPVRDAVIAQVEVAQVRQPFQRGQVGNVVEEQFEIFQIFQLCQRGNIRDIVRRENQHLQLRQILQEGQIADLVVPNVQRNQIVAVFEYRECLAGVELALIGMLGGEIGSYAA